MLNKKEVEDIFRLTPNQEALLIHHAQAPAEDGGFIQIKSSMAGTADPGCWNQAWNLTIEKTPTLRTSIHWKDLKHPVQVVHKKEEIQVHFEDLTSAEREDAESVYNEYLINDKSAGLSLTNCPPMRFALFQFPQDNYRYVWTCHHALLDGWSGALVLQSVTRTYNELRQGKPVSLNTSPSFKTYYSWLQQQSISHGAKSWQRILNEVYPRNKDTEFLNGRQSPTNYKTQSFTSGEKVFAELADLAKSQGITQPTLISAILGIVLSFSKQEETTVLGVTVNGRTAPIDGIESMVGMFANTIPFPIRCPEEEIVNTWLQSVHKTQQQVGEFEFHNPSQIHQWLDLGGNDPLFDTLLVYTNYPVEIDGNEESSLDGAITSIYPLTISLDTSNEIKVTLSFDQSTLDSDWIAKFGATFLHLLSIFPNHLYSSLRELKSEIEKVLPVYRKPEQRPQISHPKDAPQNETEEKLLELWKNFLRIDDLGTNDNFFDVGGSSLTAMRLVALMSKAFSKRIPLSALFQNPTAAAIAAYLGHDEESGLFAPIKRTNREALLPLSPQEQGLWFVQQASSDSADYNMTWAVRLIGAFDFDRFSEAVGALIEKHESLRTSYQSIDSSPYRKIEKTCSIPTRLINRDSDSLPTEESKIRDWIIDLLSRPFDLSCAPLFRINCIRYNEDDHLLIFNMHHIIGDNWALAVFAAEINKAYQSIESYRRQEVPNIQYADYAAWTDLRISDETLTDSRKFWKSYLSSAPLLTDLPTDFTRPPTKSGTGKTKTFRLSDQTFNALKDLSKKGNATAFHALFVLVAQWISKLSGQKEVVIGTPIALRERVELQSIIGYFLNTVPLRFGIEKDDSFSSSIKKARANILDVFEHSELPFIDIISQLDLKRRSINDNPISVLFTYDDEGQDLLDIPGIKSETIQVHNNTSKFDLALYCQSKRNGELSGTVEYSDELFSDETIERWIKHLLTLLESAIKDPFKTNSETSLVSTSEFDQLIYGWNNTFQEFDRNLMLHELFDQQVAKNSSKTAVRFNSEEITYGDLNDRANALAAHLNSMGVGRNSLVGVGLDRSIEMVIAILGTLKAGGAFVPLDPSYPQSRIEYILKDSEATAFISQKDLLDDLPEIKARKIVFDKSLLQSLDTHNKLDNKESRPQDLAYVIYTSGSTGKPKGVKIPHQAVVNFILSMAKSPGFSESDSLVAVTTISFDISILEIFLPLTQGGKLIVADKPVTTDGQELAALLETENATHLQATPVTWNMLLEDGWSGKGDLKMLCGGEPMPPELATRLFPMGAELWNMYGPTETTIWSSISKIEDPSALITIGTPIANTQFYIVDEYFNPQPPGIPGELLIGGEGLASGYQNLPDLTKEKFISNPFGKEEYEKAYRTGDLARWLPNGEVECLGRIDNQVKVRGFRIELGEIEQVLETHPAINRAVVDARKASNGERFLAAYYTLQNQDTEVEISNLKKFLSKDLPQYMVPSTFNEIQSVPLTPNGKVDRNSLPDPERQIKSVLTPPSSETEKVLSEIWCEVLKLKSVGINEDFFELGGHSLIAAKTVGRIKSRLNIKVPLNVLFTTPTIAGIADYLASQGFVSGEKETVPPMVPEVSQLDLNERRILPISHAQYRMWFLKKLEGTLVSYNMPTTWRVRGPLHIENLRRTFETIVERHEPYRTQVKEIDEEPVQVIQPPSAFRIEQIDLSDFPEDKLDFEIEKYRQIEYDTDFDLGSDLMLRASVLQIAPNDAVLLVTQHHIASDAWSTEILFREIATIYNAFCAGNNPKIDPLPFRYSDIIQQLEGQLQGARREKLLSYWREQLKDISPLELPNDRPRGSQLSKKGASISTQVESSLVERLRMIAKSQGATLQSSLLAGFITLLSRLSGQRNLTVGMPSAGRSIPEVENLIGYFLNTLVLRTDTTGDPTFVEFLKQVQNTSLAALEQQDLPFETLVDELQPERDLSRNPLFQVLINIWEGETDHNLELEGLALNRLHDKTANNKFDLTLYVEIRGNKVNLTLVYSTDLFDPQRMEIMLEQFQLLLKQVAENPRRSILDYSLATKNAPGLPELKSPIESSLQESIAEMFFDCASRHAEETAIRFENQNFSYGDLNSRVKELAAFLINRGLEPGDRVVIEGQKNVGCMVSFLACLAAGGIMVPIDEDLPNDRKRSMLSQAKPRWLIHYGSTDNSPWWKQTESAINLIEIAAEDGQLIDTDKFDSKQSNWFKPDLSSPAYVFFTSGTTGEPKGILGRHAGLSHFINWQRKQFSVGPNDRVSNLTSLSFDVVLREIFLTLTSGATLCLPRKGSDVLSPETLNWLEKEKITILHTVPSILDTWLREHSGGPSLESLRWTFSAGEPLQDQLVGQWRDVATKSEIVNLYGPTETTLAKCWYHVPEHPPSGVQPIGKTLPNTTALIMDRKSRVKGIGEPGEIVIHTPYRSLGYLDQRRNEPSGFIDNPYSDDPDDLLYRSGDMGRLRPDGNIDILGRLDDQIKIRGIRIEPRAVESVLDTHPAIDSCRVLGLKDEYGQSFLVAYFVAPTQPSQDELYNHLSSSLPSNMIPSAFVRLEAIPLTPNGKLDRKALPTPETNRPNLKTEFVEPRNQTETELVKLFKDLLGIEQVGIHDNFFHLGGNSLLSIRLTYRISKLLGKSIQVARIFERPTIAQLSSLLNEESVAQSYSMLMGGEKTAAPVFFLPGITRNALVFQKVVDHMKMKAGYYGIELPIPQNEVEPHKSLKEIAKHCADEIRKIQPEGPYKLVGFSFGGLVAFETARQLRGNDKTNSKVALFDSWQRTVANLSRAQRLDWMSKMLKTQPISYLNFLTKKILIKLFGSVGIDIAPKNYGVTEILTGGIEPLDTNDLHYQNVLEPLQVDMINFNTRESLYSASSGPLIEQWQTYCLGQLNYYQIDAEYHNQIFDEQHLDQSCEQLEIFLRN